MWPGGARQVLAPEDGRGVEDEIVLGAGIDRCGPMLWPSASLQRCSFTDDFQTGNVGRRIAVIFPADQAGDAISLLHSRAFKDPMVGLGADPITAAIDRIDVASADQRNHRAESVAMTIVASEAEFDSSCIHPCVR